jgi:hypothetical protein
MELANMRSSRPTPLYLAALAACSAAWGCKRWRSLGARERSPGSEAAAWRRASLGSATATVADVSPTYFGTPCRTAVAALKYHTLGYEQMPDASVPGACCLPFRGNQTGSRKRLKDTERSVSATGFGEPHRNRR